MSRLSFVLLVLAACLLQLSSAFLPGRTALPVVARNSLQARASSAAGRRKSVAVMATEYWEGEWVCADCGYIYDKDQCGGLAFEDQKAGFKCPQCSAPRRRFAKKIGDTIGTTRDGGDTPIVLFSIIGGIGVIAFGIYAAFSGI